MFEFAALKDAVDERHKIEIVVADTDPDEKITDGPRLFYNIKFYDLWNEYLGVVEKDRKFFDRYYSLIVFLSLITFVLIMTDWKKD